jgi:hypothetical protein
LRAGGTVFLRCAASHNASKVFVVMAGRLGWKLRRIITVMMETSTTPMVVRGSVLLSAAFHAWAAAWNQGVFAAQCVVMDLLFRPRSVTTAIRSAETGALRRARWKSAGNASRCSMKRLAAVSRHAYKAYAVMDFCRGLNSGVGSPERGTVTTATILTTTGARQVVSLIAGIRAREEVRKPKIRVLQNVETACLRE